MDKDGDSPGLNSNSMAKCKEQRTTRKRQKTTLELFLPLLLVVRGCTDYNGRGLVVVLLSTIQHHQQGSSSMANREPFEHIKR